jgi:hypothetical protein
VILCTVYIVLGYSVVSTLLFRSRTEEKGFLGVQART